MGRRKERRLAAISAAGRRVKLDLFAEPTEVAGKPLQDEAGEDLGQEKCADVPTSPSCSGQKKENPLLLLGQYSDDETDDSSSKIQSFAADGTSLVDKSLKVDEHINSSEQSDISADPYAADDPKLDSDGLTTRDKLDAVVEESNTWASENKIQSSTEKSPIEDSSLQNFGEISSEWKMVMHEESKSYYYWNTLTGETSWEVPNVLVNAGKNSAVTSDVSDLGLGAVDANIDGVEFVSASASACTTTNGGNNGGHLNIVYNVSQSEPKCQTAEVDTHYCTPSGLLEFSSEHLAIPLDRETHGAFVPQVGEDASELQERTYAHSTGLIRICEDLLEKLKASEESGGNISQQAWTYKYIIELETRLSDCRSLFSFGSSIIPFWTNTAVQLQRIKTAIAENLGIKDFGQPDEVGDLAVSLNSNHPIVEKEGGDALIVIASSRSPDQNLHPDIDQSPVLTDIRKSKSPQRTPETELDETTSSVCIEQSVDMQPESKVDLNPHEDADMDVEMELDDDIPVAPLGTVESIGTEQPGCQNVQDCIPPVPSDEFIVPPPPDEEYPPPPPDGDPVPLPPTEEPPSIAEVPYPETVQLLPYTEHYDTPYSASSYQYYAATVTEAQSSGYYSHIGGSHVSQTQNQEYFELVASTSYPAPGAVAVEPVVLYDAHTGIAPSGPVSTNYESSVIYAEPGFNDLGNIYTSSLNGSVELITNIDEKMELLSQKLESELSNFHSGIERTSIPVSTSSLVASTQGDASSNGTVADAAFTAARNQTKARTKKRVSAVTVASTLRSNKKVSSLVDKWRAAKEELHGDDDDEPEDAYEIFEKKRKKEIEEWHAKQIASGEAQDNANFVPLRGDWRQRVKRKQNSESSAVSSQAPAEQVVKDKKQPDLVELAKGLPPGWQAYWDENSKEVYYGNLKTSETTWTRPSI